MKKFQYKWDGEIFLLHIQLDFNEDSERKVELIRYFDRENENLKRDLIKIPKGSESGSHRFIISKSRPNEKNITVEYSDNIVLEAFIIDDRAYYPTESFYRE